MPEEWEEKPAQSLQKVGQPDDNFNDASEKLKNAQNTMTMIKLKMPLG